MSLKRRNTVRRPTPARSATASALGSITPERTSSSIARAMRRRLSFARWRRPSSSSITSERDTGGLTRALNEGVDHVGDLLGLVLLQEVSGALDDDVILAPGAGNSFLEALVAPTRDRILIAEGG